MAGPLQVDPGDRPVGDQPVAAGRHRADDAHPADRVPRRWRRRSREDGPVVAVMMTALAVLAVAAAPDLLGLTGARATLTRLAGGAGIVLVLLGRSARRRRRNSRAVLGR